MSDAVGLVRAVLADACRSESEARRVIDAALASEVDVLDYCAARFGIGQGLVFERAAQWADLAFAPAIPGGVAAAPGIVRIDSLANLRTVKARLFDRDVVYAAPGYLEVLRLKGYRERSPDLRRRLCIVPSAALRSALAAGNTEALMIEARQRLARRWPYASGHLDLTLMARIGFVLALAVVILIAAIAPFWNRALLLPIVGLLLVAPSIARLLAVMPHPHADEIDPPLLDDADLPIYSVLIPLRDEAHMVPMLQQAMSRLDYPPEKLDIKFVVESRSETTVVAVKAILGDGRFELIEVPDSAPRTKPKALDYALPFVRGQYTVIYDAEDIPDPNQLRLAAARFANEPSIDCLQAELVVDNAGENLIAALFAGEYAGLFGYMLPALARWRLPLPLGGTSNHFRVSALREVGGWDAFNVTEDADLGVRLARLRYRTGTLASQTREEAPITLPAWMAQRSRWMKGWMQTFIVHNRSPRRFLDDIGWRGFLAFQIFVGGMIISPILHTVFVSTLLVQLIVGVPWTSFEVDIWMAVHAAILVIGYGGSLALMAAGLIRIGQQRLLLHQIALPIYWMLHSAATIRGAHELLVKPFFWAKTTHGKTRVLRTVDQPRPVRTPRTVPVSASVPSS